MPKQHVLFGRPIPRFGTRRLSFLLVSISIFALFSLIVTLPTAIPAGPSLSKYTDTKISIPRLKNSLSHSILNPFRQPSHPPPRQKNDTNGESSWWADWKWLSVPFSSSLTLDEDRSLLPHLKPRPPIYCYYDATVPKDSPSKDAESALLLTWRRAWWAQGFKPIILSAAEAMNNPLYDNLQRLDIEPDLKTDTMRWLAWENMGGGLLSHHTLLPMAPREDPLLTHLRRGEYPQVTRWNGLGNGLFSGDKKEITAAIKAVLDSPHLKTSKDFVAASPPEIFNVDEFPGALAYYDAKTIEKKYARVAGAISEDRAAGLNGLNLLINAHLHTAWRNIFSDGIAVLKPLPQHTTHLISDAWDLAHQLAQCPISPMPSTCPPNLPSCSPCVASSPMRISTPSRYRNKTNLYTIGTVPHPYTLATVSNHLEKLDVPWIRRVSQRDPWITAITTDLLGQGMPGGPRVLRFKEAVAGDFATFHSLWLTAEKEVPGDIHWHFGFAIPANVSDGRSTTPVPGPERRPLPGPEPGDGPRATKEDLDKELPLVAQARGVVGSAFARERAVKQAVEAWNLADTEAWKFARAFLARRVVERTEWEQEESRYTRGAGSEKGRSGGWARWGDKKDD